MDEMKSKVYIQIDAESRIIRCEGGYTIGNIDNIDEWILIDEGTGDRYNLCQSHYFGGGLYTDDGICRYVWESDTYRLRTDEEIEADRPEPVEPEPDPIVAEIEALKTDVQNTTAAVVETNRALESAVADLDAEKKITAALQDELAAEKVKSAALAEELEATKILLGVE